MRLAVKDRPLFTWNLVISTAASPGLRAFWTSRQVAVERVFLLRKTLAEILASASSVWLICWLSCPIWGVIIGAGGGEGRRTGLFRSEFCRGWRVRGGCPLAREPGSTGCGAFGDEAALGEERIVHFPARAG